MQFLQQFAQREDITSIVRSAMAQPFVHGATLELDQYWAEAWLLEKAFGRPKMERLVRASLEYWGYRRLPGPFGSVRALGWPAGTDDEPGATFSPPTASDLDKWEPPFWKDYSYMLGEESSMYPVRVRILLYPPSGDKRVVLPELPSTTRVWVEFESRQPGVLFADPKKKYRPVLGGTSVGLGSSDYGTLGGMLKDASGNFYGLTCSHVVDQNAGVDQPAQIDNHSSGAIIGKRIAGTTLNVCASTPTTPCNCWSGGKPVNEVDAALIELDPTTSCKMEVLDIGQISGIRSNFMPPLAVEMTGRSSSNRQLHVGALVLAIRLTDHKGKSYCFTNLFEIKWPSFARLVLGRPIQNGDSGAWVCAPSATGFDFLGMVIGGNRTVGYANLSRSLEDWWANKEHLSLSVA